MSTEVPTTDDLTGAASDGAVPGTVLALGETVGRSVLGPGVGTAAGGIAAAATQSGDMRGTAALVAVERGMNELFSGMGGSGGSGRRRL